MIICGFLNKAIYEEGHMDSAPSQNGTNVKLEKSETYLVYPNAQRMEKGEDVKPVLD